ncbi:MAG: nucleoside-diphosphate kinase [Candidatus Krumholzibacteria bacterium]|nr:nucleoside-diphosphate kinase [Candidatus Krumholzibacteria bacterium]
MQKTFFMIKPEIVAARTQRCGEILAMVNADGFRITELALRRLARPTVAEFYAEHHGKPFYDNLLEYITSGPVICAGLEREDAVGRLRALIGATDPAKAAAGTIRARFGTSLTQNAVHASAGRADAERELALIFGR